MIKYFLVLLLLVSCTHQKPVLEKGPRELLFPYGTYQHQIRVTPTKAPPKGPKIIEFKGVFIFQKDKMKLVGLSPIGTTLFRIEESFDTGELKIETFLEPLRKAEDKIKQSYTIIRDILTLPMVNLESKTIKVLKWDVDKYPQELLLTSTDKPVSLKIDKYDKNKIPDEMLLVHPDFNLAIKVMNYEL